MLGVTIVRPSRTRHVGGAQIGVPFPPCHGSFSALRGGARGLPPYAAASMPNMSESVKLIAELVDSGI